MTQRGRMRSALSASGRAARYSFGLDSRTPAAFIIVFFSNGSSCVSDMTLRQAAICSWMLILTGHTFVQEPFSVEENTTLLYFRALKVGSRITPIGPAYVAP